MDNENKTAVKVRALKQSIRVMGSLVFSLRISTWLILGLADFLWGKTAFGVKINIKCKFGKFKDGIFKKIKQAALDYKANHFDLRVDSTLLVPGARSVITVLINYYADPFRTGGCA
jgi:hypothetical protein